MGLNAPRDGPAVRSDPDSAYLCHGQTLRRSDGLPKALRPCSYVGFEDLHRSAVFLFVLISAIAGVLLVILPWTPEWTDNYLLLSYPSLRTLISTGFFRGLCSGLGLLDIWIGFWEALHYHEHH